MMSLTVRSINTPATTINAGKSHAHMKPKAYDIFPMGKDANLLMASDSGSFQMVGSEFDLNRNSRTHLMDGLSDAAARKVMSEHQTQQQNLTSPRFNAQTELDYKPTYIKSISGLWLLVAGKDPSCEIYSAHTLRKARTLHTEGRVLCAEGTRKYCIVGVT